MKKYSILPLLVLSLASTSAQAVDPSSVLIRVYAIAASLNTDCSNPILVKNYGAAGQEFEFTVTPDIGNGGASPGVYPCVMLKMSDVITYKPASTSGSCTADRSYTRDVCRAGTNYTPLNIAADGTVSFGANTGCTGTQSSPVNDQPTLFLSTGSASSSGGNTFLQPTSTANGIKLNGAFVVTGAGTGTFGVDFHGKIDGGQALCDLNAPVFSFK